MKRKKKIKKIFYGTLATILVFAIFSSCSDKKEIKIYVKEINLIYTKPVLISNLDTISKFNSKINYEIRFDLINNTEKKLEVVLNDLRTNEYTFDLMLKLSDTQINYYNYPFSQVNYPSINKIALNPNEKEYIEMESPLFNFYYNISMMTIDSLKEVLNKSEKSIFLKNTKFKYQVDHKNITINAVPNNYE